MGVNGKDGLTLTTVFARLMGEFFLFLKVERTCDEAVRQLVDVGILAGAVQGLALESLNLVYLVEVRPLPL